MRRSILPALLVVALASPRAQAGAAADEQPSASLEFVTYYDNLRVTGDSHIGFVQNQTKAHPWHLWEMYGVSRFAWRTGASSQPLNVDGGVPSFSMVVEARTGDVGLGAAFPGAPLHIVRNDADRHLVIESNDNPTPSDLLRLVNNGPATMRFDDTFAGAVWGLGQLASGNFFITSGAIAFDLTPAGNLTIAGALTQLSDRASKEQVVPVDEEGLLERVASLPLATWRYQDEEVLHLGPMAQDFSAAFGLGSDERHVAPSDVAGVGLAAARGLEARVRGLEHEAARLLEQLEREAAALQAQRAQLARLKAVRDGGQY